MSTFLVCLKNWKVKQLTHGGVSEEHEMVFNARKGTELDGACQVMQSPATHYKSLCSHTARQGGLKSRGEEVSYTNLHANV